MGRKKILIIEDEAVIRSSLLKFLTKQGFKTSEAGSIDEAKSFDLDQFSLIITDLRLPGPIGTDIIQIAPRVPVLVMTSYASVDSAVDAMKLGAVDYIAKPFDYDDLLTTVNEIIENFSCVADVVYKRLDKENNLISKARSLYHFVYKDERWKIYMISNVDADQDL